MTTISSSTTLGLTLGSPAYYSPVDIAAGVTITNSGSAGIQARGEPWTIQNSGVISAPYGILLSSGGSITNAVSASITGVLAAIQLGAFAAVLNEGKIAGTGTVVGSGFGIYASGGASITNAVSAVVEGRTAIYGAAGATVSNYGTIMGTGDTTLTLPGGGGVVDDVSKGIVLKAGGLIFNATSALISGGKYGVYVSGGAGSVINAGSILASSFIPSVDLKAGGSVTNASSGTITDVMIAGGAATVVNSGSIWNSGFPGYAVYLISGGSVTNTNGGSIIGDGAGVGIFNGIGTVVNEGRIFESGFFGVRLASGGSVINTTSAYISGEVGVSLYDGGTVINAGTISTGGPVSMTPDSRDAVVFGGTIDNRLVVDPGAVFIGSVYGSASASNMIELASAASIGTLAGLGSQFTGFGSIAFDTGARWLISGNPTGLNGTISGFASGDTIEVDNITVTSSGYADGILTLSETSGSVELNLPGDFAASDFVVTNTTDGADITLAEAVPCFAAGTRIATEHREVTVERLRIGDVVRTVSGGVQTIQWIGRREVDCRRHRDPERVWPICVSPDAFGEGRPRRALFLSPDHSVYMEDVLIPIKFLVNDSTIRQIEVEHIAYYHIELPQHDVVLAEGLPSESYLETGARAAFSNPGVVQQLYPDFVPDQDRVAMIWKWFGYAPLLGESDQFNRVRSQLQWQASMLDASRQERQITRKWHRRRSIHQSARALSPNRKATA